MTAWQVYEALNGPLGPERLDYLFAALQATLANVNKSKRAKTRTAKDFAPPWADVKRWPWATTQDGPKDGYELLELVKSMNKSMGGRTESRGDH